MERRDLAEIVIRHEMEAKVTYNMLARGTLRSTHRGDLEGARLAQKVSAHYFRKLMGWN